jgi:antitoxin component HigA of HigAB toxin-antitoxin module
MENLLKKHWYSIFNELKERWPDLTQSDLEYIYGDRTRLTAVLKKRRHISTEEVLRDIDEFVQTLNIHQRITAVKS